MIIIVKIADAQRASAYFLGENMIYYKYIDDSMDKRKVQHEAGFQLLQELEREEYGLDIIKSDITADDKGKPCFVSPNYGYFNISHCSGLVCVMKHHSPCGIDCEKIGEFREKVCSRIFSDDEQEYVRGLSDEKKKEAFYILWTLKEAYGKYTGNGIADLKNVSFSFYNEVLISDHPELYFRVYMEGEYVLSYCIDKQDGNNEHDMGCPFGTRIY